MKSKRYIWILAMVVTQLLCLGCVHLNGDPFDEQTRMNFVPEIKPQPKPSTHQTTKAVISGTKYPTTESFVVNALFFRNEDDTDPVAAYIPSQKVSYLDDAWRTETPYYWPLSGFMDFEFFSPYNVGATFDINKGVVLDDYSITHTLDNGDIITDESLKDESNLSKARIDFCCAEQQIEKINCASHPAIVNPLFKHYLTQICFTVTPLKFFSQSSIEGDEIRTNNVTIHLDDIYFDSLYYIGDFQQNVDHPSDVWTVDTLQYYNYVFMNREREHGTELVYNNDSTPKTVPVYNRDGVTPLEILMMPQDLHPNASMRLKYSVRQTITLKKGDNEAITETDYVVQHEGQCYLASITPIPWGPGKKIVYNLIIGLDEILFIAKPVDWVPQEGEGDLN